MNILQKLVEEQGVLILDGAMGTMLMAAGLTQGDPPETWNEIHPERVAAVHRAYIEAGSNIVLTNSFGGSRYRLKLHNLQDRAEELNAAAARVARAEADAAKAAGRTVMVGGSMGPTGELFQPMGEMTFEEAVEAFAEQARGLAAGGADLLWIETMSDLDEVKAAVVGAQSATNLPVCATMTFDTNGHTMMGVSPAKAAVELGALGLAAVGANCGTGPDELEVAVAAMRAVNPDLLIIAKANAGIPHYSAEGLAYDGTPDVMAVYAQRVKGLGVTLIGACCGSSPAHIAAMREALVQSIPDEIMARVAQIQATAASAVAGEADDEGGRPRRRRRRER